MRHQKQTTKLNRTVSHRRCMFANMLKSLIVNGRIETTVEKAKALKRYADKMITVGKENNLAARRKAKAKMMIRFNKLTSRQARHAREGRQYAFNDDRLVLDELFMELAPRFAGRNGGYTRLVRTGRRVGDNAEMCFIEYLPAEEQVESAMTV